MAVKLICGQAKNFAGDADLVFTHPYAELPPQLCGKPAIINLYGNSDMRRVECETLWMPGAHLEPIGTWGKGGRNTIYVSNLPALPIDLSDLMEDHAEAPKNGGWFPLSLCTLLLGLYSQPGKTVFDGFMGRGTVGRACQILGMDFIGIDSNPARVDLARRYLGIEE